MNILTRDRTAVNGSTACSQQHLIRQFMRGPSQRLFSSSGLAWSGLLLEQHRLDPADWSAAKLSGSILCLWNNRASLRCDHPDANGNFVPKLVHPGTLSLYIAGVLPSVRLSIASLGILCAFDQDLLREVEDEIRHESNVRSVADGLIAQDKRCFLDPPLQRIIHRLAEEARTGGARGRLFADEQIARLVDRLLALTHARTKANWLTYKLDGTILRRLTDRMEATPHTDLDLNTLATEGGCSKRHLLRTFRASTGRSPHQYVLDLRLEKARRLMLKPSLSLIDIALECGFANQAHFTRAFRQRLGVPPSEFRRQL